MKYAMIGDFHGAELSGLERALRFENPDFLICTGDFDQTRTIHQFMEMEERYRMAGKTVVKVPGNHDHAILNNLEINSGALKSQGKSSYELHYELTRDPAALHYISNLVNSDNPRYTNNRATIFLDEGRFGREYQTAVIHGAYDGDLSSFPNCPEKIRDLWTRLRTENDYRKNFRAMEQKGYNIMIRGHDHNAAYVYSDPEKGVVSYAPAGKGSAFRLLNYRKHTINPGALFNGLFATIDTKVSGEEFPILKYHRV